MHTFIDNYRYELKFEMNLSQAEYLKYKLSLLLPYDEFSTKQDGSYYIRSLYFDDIYDKAYYEKINGLEEREKYRIRYYNFDTSYIVLEIKGKKGNIGYKLQEEISKEEFNFIIEEEYDKINTENRKVLEKFIIDTKRKNLIPSIIVDYERTAYTYPVSDVRLTFDSEISSGRYNTDFFDKDIMLYKVLEPNKIILEVKFNDFLPNFIKEIIQSIPMTRISMSKFALCRELKGNVVV